MDKDWDRNRRFYLYEKVKAEFVVVRCVIAGDESSGFLVFGFGVFRRSFNKNYFSWPWLLSWHARKGEDSWSR
ncbi:hypothetical protein P8452_62759 [Trifolium repens]|nr:hypothetical protein P8452_62759 [Trifolium repens]